MSASVSTTEDVFVTVCTGDTEITDARPASGGVTLRFENVSVWVSSNEAARIVAILTGKA